MRVVCDVSYDTSGHDDFLKHFLRPSLKFPNHHSISYDFFYICFAGNDNGGGASVGRGMSRGPGRRLTERLPVLRPPNRDKTGQQQLIVNMILLLFTRGLQIYQNYIWESFVLLHSNYCDSQHIFENKSYFRKLKRICW